MKNKHFKVEDVFGEVISKDSISPEQTTKSNKFLAKMMWICFWYKINLFKSTKGKNIKFEPSVPPDNSNF